MISDVLKILILIGLSDLVTRCMIQCCQMQNDVCSSCPSGMHLYRGNCLLDLRAVCRMIMALTACSASSITYFKVVYALDSCYF